MLSLASRAGSIPVGPARDASLRIACSSLTSLYARTAAWYGRGDNWREDCLAHPLEGGGAPERAARLSQLPVPEAPVAPSPMALATALGGYPGDGSDPLAADGDSLMYALSHSGMVLSHHITPPALAALTVQVPRCVL